jgi:hypothetical protein
MKSGTHFFQTELMFVRSVHYSDYLEHDLCIQDEFTIPTSPYIMSSQLVLSSTWQKLLRNMATGHSPTTKICFNDVIVFSLHEAGKSIWKLVCGNFYSCDV